MSESHWHILALFVGIAAVDLGQYDPEALATLRDELQQSVQTRIGKTVDLGADDGQSDRIGREQSLIKSIAKYLADH